MEQKKKSKVPFIIGGVLAAAVIGTYVGFAINYQTHFLPKTVVNGVDAAGRSWEDVQKELLVKSETYELNITGRDGITDRLDTKDIDLIMDFGSGIEDAQTMQNEWTWPVALFGGEDLQIESSLSYSKEKLNKVIDAMNCMDEEKAKAPTDAYLSEYSKENGVTIIPEEENNLLKRDVFENMIISQVETLGSEITLEMLEEADAYEHPVIYRDNSKLVSEMEQRNKMTQVTLKYHFDQNEEVVDGTLINTWLVTDESNKVSVDPALAREYVNSLARHYETFGSKSREFKTSYGKTIKIEGGDYGWWMNRAKTTDELVAAVEAGEDKDMTPIYNQEAASFSGPDYGDSYVEVNITAQKLFLYKNGKKILETDFVSGKPSVKNTPTGVYALTYKTRAHTMNGTPSDPYRVETSFWMPFAGNVGLHDATWRSVFGGTVYKSSGSHGCVNLPYNAAKTIYQNVDKGTPVIVYQLPGTERSSTSGQGAQEISGIAIDAIDRIGEVKSNNKKSAEEKITWARTVYGDIGSAARAYVTNYQKLLDAEAALKALR